MEKRTLIKITALLFAFFLVFMFVFSQSEKTVLEEKYRTSNVNEKKTTGESAPEIKLKTEITAKSQPVQDPFPQDILWVANQLINPPSFQRPRVYLSTPQPIAWGPNCSKSKRYEKWTTLEEGLETEGLRTQDQFPKNKHVDYLNQFWTIGDRSYQMSLTWQMDTPATYKVEFFSSKDPTFKSQVTYEKIQNKESVVLDPISAYELIENQLKSIQSLNGKEGGRTLMVSQLKDGVKQEVEYLNGQAIKYAAGGVFCLSKEDMKRSHCYCSGVQ